MRTLVTPLLKQKIEAINDKSRSLLSSTLKLLESSTKDQIINPSYPLKVLSLNKDIYVIKVDDVRIFFFFGNDSEGDYVTLLDISESRKEPIISDYFAIKNPRTNS